mgnify:FL=1
MYGFLVTASKRRHKWDNVIFITWHIFDQCCQLSSLTVHVTTLTEANVILRGSKNSILRLKLHSLPFLQIIYLINALFCNIVYYSALNLFIYCSALNLLIYIFHDFSSGVNVISIWVDVSNKNCTSISIQISLEFESILQILRGNNTSVNLSGQ